MPRPPSSSAQRPPTSTGAQHHTQQYTYDYDNEEEDLEEESDAEDVFAFLPPSTADQEQHHYLTQDDPLQTPIAYPSPTFDPHARFPADTPLAGTSYPPPISPPSTESNGQDDPYRMRRLSSREVHVALPGTSSEKDPEAARTESLVSQSMIGDDETDKEGSIKCARISSDLTNKSY